MFKKLQKQIIRRHKLEDITFFTACNDQKFKSNEENLIKDVKNHLRLEKLKKETIKSIRNLFRLEKENNATKIESFKILEKFLDYTMNINQVKNKNLFEIKEEKNYYKLVNVGNIWSSNYFEYKNNSDRSKALSIEHQQMIIQVII